MLLLLLVQTKILFAEENGDGDDESSTLSTGTIDQLLVDYKTARQNNIDGVKYELIEVRDEINDLIAHPDKIEEVIETEEVVVTVKPKVETPVPAAAPKPTAPTPDASKPKPAKKDIKRPVVAQALRLLPKKEANVGNDINNIATATKIKPVYNKHDNDGSLLDQDTEKWACVHDTDSGLMWEVKSDDGSMRNSANLYSWFKPENQVENGIPDGGRCQGDAACDTNAYIQAMNEQNFCGHNDWQLPTREQMQTLVHLKNNHEPVKINKAYFPETVASWYWTASENNDNNDFAWYVLFRNGVSLSDLKERPKHIRLVRNYI